jgi:FAD/FMN-containing dehydrogenase/Fe-S oxidoreductase
VQVIEAPAPIDAAELEADLKRAIEGEVRFDTLSRALYSTDASVYLIRPVGVAIPRTREDILRIMEICRRHRCPITMRGGGTSQAGQAIGAGLQVDISKYYNRLLTVNAEEQWAIVEPGIVLDELNAQLAPLKLRFAPDISTASRATLGGMMANNSAGARSVLYGTTIAHVLEQTVALSDGSIAKFRDTPRDQVPTGDSLEASLYSTVLRLASEHAGEIDRRYPKILRRVGGYNLNEFVDPAKPVNLSKLMVGSEGTLGVVLEAKVKLVPLPKAKAVMVITFDDLLEALAASPVILKHSPSAIEVMDKSILDHTRQNHNLNRIRETFIEGDPAATLCVEFYGDRAEDLPLRLRALEDDLRSRKIGRAYRPETDLAQQARIWSLRESALGLSMAMKEDAKSISFVEDTAVTPERLSEFIGRFLTLLKTHGTTAGVYAHASVGCLHVRPVINLKSEAGVRKFEAIASDVADLVLEFGGALSGEHGDGLVRSPFMRRMFGDTLYEAFREIKRTADPQGLLNPGKIVDAPPITNDLRFGAKYQTPQLPSHFDFSGYGGMGGAIEMCSGVGACRKRLAGTMCPSYMATSDEKHTTRGRANVLRLAMNGQLGEQNLADKSVKEVLDLCLECRACKSECPVGVDMAAFKSEFLSQYWERHGTPLRAKLLGHVADLSVWGSRFAPVSNWLSAPAKMFLGRTPPAWKHQTFQNRVTRHNPVRSEPRPSGSGNENVTLFNDTFLNHYHPEIGVSALEVLERAGRTVNVIRPGCCGRPLISQGLLAEARVKAETLTEALHPLADRGEKILFLEPSCLSAVKEDAPSLLRGDLQQHARTVAQACVMFEEYAAELDLPLREGPKRILVHGHCHQKSMGMLSATMSLMSRIPGASVIDLDAGCCGMAGSFGYSHVEVSKDIANLRLLPKVRKMEPGDVLVAPGTSCRQQVKDLAGHTALHPVELVRDLLK